MKCLLLGAGYATRLYPLTKDRPKPLLPVGGVPILERTCNRLLSLEGLDGVQAVALENGAMRLTVAQVHRAVPALLEELKRQQVGLSRLTTHDATLEDVFVSLTGRHLRDG